jgi:hypothetical protein
MDFSTYQSGVAKLNASLNRGHVFMALMALGDFVPVRLKAYHPVNGNFKPIPEFSVNEEAEKEFADASTQKGQHQRGTLEHSDETDTGLVNQGLPADYPVLLYAEVAGTQPIGEVAEFNVGQELADYERELASGDEFNALRKLYTNVGRAFGRSATDVVFGVARKLVGQEFKAKVAAIG